jgi:hypothetical protein
MVPLASLLRPWLTASSSSDSESSTRLHHSSYLVILLISSSILSGPTFPIVVFSRNLSKRFSHRGFPSRVKAPVVGSFHTSRRTASKVGQRSRTCVLVIVGRCMLSYLSSQNQHPAWARLPIRFRYTPREPMIGTKLERYPGLSIACLIHCTLFGWSRYNCVHPPIT